ncbi:Ras-related protein RABA2a [Tritrichomonas foetus]|uniref:Ras-related protein RABA2a n=1 Tax=Tritrichomonas foetus TaxID=1144522 RepID=A0A1J4L692_9EUKA|nr:Ras-related protein RABA2a [Tritrichomonas foetus]|eukprot:OHT17532.1 Ras-related protein RABA2a [Tritrichomonas foetus]
MHDRFYKFSMANENQDFVVKIVLAGDSGVGKTNILSRFTRDFFSEDSKSTIGVEFSTKNIVVDNKLVKASIWDTAGQEHYKSITRAYFHGALGAMIIFDITQATSFESAARWLKDIRENAEKDVIIMLVGNKNDLADSRTVLEEEAIQYAKAEQLLYIETSALISTNIAEAFNILVTEIVHKMSQNSKGLKPQIQNSLPLEDDSVPMKTGIKVTSEQKAPEKKSCCD